MHIDAHSSLCVTSNNLRVQTFVSSIGWFVLSMDLHTNNLDVFHSSISIMQKYFVVADRITASNSKGAEKILPRSYMKSIPSIFVSQASASIMLQQQLNYFTALFGTGHHKRGPISTL